jgi:hypothetical protein
MDIKISMPALTETKTNGKLVKLINEMNNYYDQGTIKLVGIYPFERSIQNIKYGNMDAHLPILKNNVTASKTDDMILTTVPVNKVIFVLYTLADTQIDLNNLSNYSIGTDRSHVKLFDFPTTGQLNSETGVKMVEKKRIDGWLFGQGVVDPVLKRLNITSLKKQYFGSFDVFFLVKNSEKGKKVALILDEIILKMKKDGKLQEILGYFSQKKFTENIE